MLVRMRDDPLGRVGDPGVPGHRLDPGNRAAVGYQARSRGPKFLADRVGLVAGGKMLLDVAPGIQQEPFNQIARPAILPVLGKRAGEKSLQSSDLVTEGPGKG